MLSIQHRFLFIHIPKTGGNSVQEILLPYSMDKKVMDHKQDGIERFDLTNKELGTNKHSRLGEYRKKLPSELFASLFKFATLRNPWDRMVSFYWMPYKGNIEWDRNEFRKVILQTVPSAHLIEGGIDHLMRFEHLQEDFNQVCDKIGIARQQLPRRNASKHDHYSTYYDDELIELVRQHHGCDIEYGGYEFEKVMP